MDHVAHDGGVVQLLDGVLGAPGAGEEHPGKTQVLAGLGVEEDLHLLHLAELGAHIRQEGLLDVVVEAGEGHLLERDLAHVELVQLRTEQSRRRHVGWMNVDWRGVCVCVSFICEELGVAINGVLLQLN